MTDLIATYLLHSTVILGATLLLIRLPGLRRAAARDTLIRTAFVVSLLTPWGAHSPAHMPIPVSPPTAEIAALPPSHERGGDLDANIAARSTESSALYPQARPLDPPVSVHRLMALVPWALLLLAIVAIGLFARAAAHARRLIRRARPMDVQIVAAHDEPHARVLTTEELDVPVAIGLRTILLPANITTSLDSGELRAVLAHELTHLRRRDPIWNTLLSFATHALACQPLNLLALRAWRRASEEVCDAAAQERADQPLDLPRALLKLAHCRTTLPTFTVGVVDKTHLTHRVEALLNERETRMKPSRLIALALIPLAVGLLLPIVSSAQPTTSLAGMKVVIDPGHSVSNPGGVGFAREADVVLAVALQVRGMLNEHGIDVILTREAGEGPDLLLRRARVDDDTDAFISIHASASTQNTTHGVQTWVAPPSEANEATHSLDLELARTLQAEMIQSTNARDRGVHEQDWYVLQDLQAPAALVEVGFVTHTYEGARLATSAYQEQLAQAIVDGILQFFRAKLVEPTSEVDKPAFTVFLEPDANPEALLQHIGARNGVVPHSVAFVSRDEALKGLRAQHPSLLQQAPPSFANPLPHSISFQVVDKNAIHATMEWLQRLPGIESIERPHLDALNVDHVLPASG